MKYIITLSIFFYKVVFLFAQTDNSGSLQGKVFDSLGKVPIEFASVVVYKSTDTTKKKTVLTNANGIFLVKGIPLHSDLRLFISYAGYSDYQKEFSLDGKEVLNLGDIQMRGVAKELDTVLIVSQIPPVTIKKDTVEYNAASFETRPHAILEELLKRLPGLEVDIHGTITFHGKRVSKLLVDGREFFGGDILMATRNLPADLVNKVQVMDTKTLEQSFNNLTLDGMDKTINIKLKKSKNNLFGHIRGGGGTDSRYELGGMINYFDGSKKLSIIGSGNNINNVGFSSGADLGAVNPGNGVIESKLGGINFNDDWSKRIRINGSYVYDQTSTTNESVLDRKQMIVGDSSFSSSTENNQYEYSKGNRAQFTIDYTPDSSDIINIVPELTLRNFRNSSENNIATLTSGGEKMNESRGNILGDGASDYYSLQLFWGRRLNSRGRSFSMSFNGSQNQQKNNSLNQSKNIFYRNNLIDSASNLDQRILTNSNTDIYRFNFSYNEPINKFFRLFLNENVDLIHSYTVKKTYKLDSNDHILGLDTDFSGNFNSYTTTNSTNFSMEYNRKRWQISAGVTGIYNKLNNYSDPGKENLEQQQFNFSPLANITYHMDQEKTVQFNYSANTQQPTSDQLQPVPDNSNPLNIKMGNPNLKPSFFQNYMIGFSRYSASQNIDFSVQYAMCNNKIINSVFYDDYGRQITQFVNVNGSFGINGNIAITRTKKIENSVAHLSLGAGINYTIDISLVNNRQAISEFTNLSSTISGGCNYKDIVSLDFGYSLSYNRVQYDNNAEQQTNYITQNLSNNISVYVKSFRLISSINYTYNSNVAPGFNRNSLLWNIGIAQSLFKDQRAQLKLIVYDLLKQNTNLHRTVNSNYIEDAQSNILQRYALLSFTYYLRNNGKKGK